MRALLLVLVLLAAPALAHKSSDSYLDLGIDEGGAISARWDIALRDLDVLLPLDADDNRRLTWGEVQGAITVIRALARSALVLERGGDACILDAAAPALRIDTHVDGTYAVLALRGQCPAHGALRIDYRLLHGVDADHRGLLHLRDGDAEQALVLVPGRPLRVAADRDLALWLGHVRNGVHHIASGYDHLLFLLSLLLPVVLAAGSGGLGRVLRDTVALVTAFTLAHSLTLALAALEILSLPSRLVESLIAASVLLAALDNLRAAAPRTRAAMAFVFGLIHGFGFAALLQGLPAGLEDRLLALAGFNLGVEAGQLIAVALFVPIACAIARWHHIGYRRWGLHGGSLAIAGISLVWLFQRVFDVQLIPG